jgi:hypothetical protein
VKSCPEKVPDPAWDVLSTARAGMLEVLRTREVWSGRSDLIVGPDRRAIMIKKVKDGYKVLSSKGKNLGGPYKTLEEAKKRLRQVEFFKHRKA